MADVNANIDININSSNALAQLKSLQRQIAQFHTSIARSSESAALAQKGLQKNLLNSINAISGFTAEMRTVKTSAESFTDSLEKNKFSMREYFRYAGASTKTFGKLFKSEFDTIGKVSEERVKRLQTQYIKMGRDTSGAMQAIAVMPTNLNMDDYTTKVQLAAQKQALFNQLMKQGSTNLLNFGKNTQWAGRQLMVGFTLPLMLVGSTAAKTFMEMEAQAIKFKKVYGDLFTPTSETKQALSDITELGKQFTKYGIAVSTTVGLAAEAAAAGFSGLDLQRQTTAATKLSILGQIDSQKSLETTIALQNAFGMSSDKLAESIDFLNAVENQTVVSLDDITTAIPKVAPVIQQLGGDVKDLTFFMAAMKEGGINASEGANALKSGLAALINPTGKAAEMLASYGINATEIVNKNKGDLKATIIEFAGALNTLDPLARARAIEQMFGKFQFARLSTLFANVTKEGNQASRVLSLANSSVEDLASLSEKELGMTAESSMNKFKKTVEDLKIALVPVGQAFLEAATPIVEFVGNVLEKFANLSSGTKKVITLLTVGIGAVGPVLLMTFGLLANGVANIIKLFLTLRAGYQRLTGQSQILGEQTQYMTMEQLDAAAAAHSLNQTHATLTQTFTAETSAIQKLIAAYSSAATASGNFARANPGMMMPGRNARKLASGIVSVPGPKGAGDIVPAMLAPGEAVVPADMAKKYAPLIQGMIAGNIPGYKVGRDPGSGSAGRVGKVIPTVVRPYGDNVSASSGLVDFLNIDSKNTADVVSLYTKQIMEEAKVSAKSVVTEIDRWRKNNISALQKAANAVNAGADATTEFAPLVEKFNVDMKKAGGPFAQFAATAEKMVPELSKDLIQAQTKAKELALNVKNSADAVKLSQVLPTNTIASELSKPGNFSKYSKIRAGAASSFGKTSGISSMGIPRFMLPNMHPSERAYKLGTSQEHVSSSLLQESQAQNLKAERAARKATSKILDSVTDGIVKEAKISSPSKETQKVGADIGRGFITGSQEYVDDAKIVGQKLAGSMVQTASGLILPSGAVGGGTGQQRPPQKGIGISDPALLSMAYQENTMRDKLKKQAAATQVMNQRMDKLNRGFMAGTFALSSLSGVASMAGGNLGKFSQILFQITGPLFALSSIIQLLTGEKIVKQIMRFKSVLGPVAIGLTALTIAIKYLNKVKEEETQRIEGLGNAALLTTNKIKNLGDFFGVVPTKSGFESKGPELNIIKEERTKVDALKETESFQKDFQKDIKRLSSATSKQAEIVFKTLQVQLKGRGFAEAEIKTILQALQEEAGKTNVKIDFKSLDLGTESGQKEISKIASTLGKAFGKNFADGFSQTSKNYKNLITKEEVNIVTQDLSENFKKSLSTTSKVFAGLLDGISAQLNNSTISSQQFSESFSNVVNTVKGLKEPAAIALLDEIFKNLPGDLAKTATGFKNVATQLLVLEALSLGTITREMIEGLKLLESSTNAYDRIDANRIKNELERRRVAKLISEDEITAIEKRLAELAAAEGKENPLAKRIQDIKNQTDSYIALRNAKIDDKTATELSNDSEIALLVIRAKTNGTLPKTIKLIKQYTEALKTQTNATKDNREATKVFTDQLEQSSALANLRDKMIDAKYASQLKSENDLLDVQKDKLDKINISIDELTKTEIDRRTKAIEANNFALESISRQEDIINQKYEVQSAALEKIATINQDIANIQKQRMSIADALSRGDISAAAELVQSARAEQASSAISRQQDALASSRDSALAALGRNALEQKNKDLQYEISVIENTTLLKLREQKTEIENIITGHERTISTLTRKVELEKLSATYSGMTRTEIDSLSGLIQAAEAAGIPFTAQLLSQATSAERLAAALREASKFKSGVSEPGSTAITPKLTPEQTKKMAELEAAKAKIQKKIAGRMYGGQITKYMAFGGRAVGSDTVPAMLTPGEFVVNKAASKRFGPLLESLNESKYPSMIGAGSSGYGAPINNISSSVSDNSTAVYNYSLGFNINGASSNANDIARAVIREIKNVDSQRIRGQRL